MKADADRNASPKSVLARLRNKALDIGVPANQIAHRYIFERFLLRLSHTPEWRGRMVLMGAMALVGLTKDLKRTTTDLDMWAIDPLSREEALAMFAAVAKTEIPDVDPIKFDLESVHVNAIRENAEAPGHQIVCTAKIGDANFKFKLEISHHASVAPMPIKMEYPTVFDDAAAPNVTVYHPATMLSEKLHAMWRFGVRSTRMKDFYDVRSLMRNVEFSGDDIAAAFRTTFSNWANEMPDPSAKLPVFGEEFAVRGERLWRDWADDKFRSDRSYVKEPFAKIATEIEPFLTRCVAMARGEEGMQDWRDGAWRDPEMPAANTAPARPEYTAIPAP